MRINSIFNRYELLEQGVFIRLFSLSGTGSLFYLLPRSKLKFELNPMHTPSKTFAKTWSLSHHFQVLNWNTWNHTIVWKKLCWDVDFLCGNDILQDRIWYISTSRRIGYGISIVAGHVKVVKLVTVVEGDPKAPFSVATTPTCKGGRFPFPWISPLYPWYVPYIVEC